MDDVNVDGHFSMSLNGNAVANAVATVGDVKVVPNIKIGNIISYDYNNEVENF